MFCPKCGNELTERGGVFYCPPGDMELSPRMTAALAERYAGSTQPDLADSARHRRSRWYCPGCGVALGEQLSCELCGQSLDDLLFELVEHHPHHEL